jgi:hypothetical protein
MNDLAVVDRGADWRRLKALVLDSGLLSDRETPSPCLTRPGSLPGVIF